MFFSLLLLCSSVFINCVLRTSFTVFFACLCCVLRLCSLCSSPVLYCVLRPFFTVFCLPLVCFSAPSTAPTPIFFFFFFFFLSQVNSFFPLTFCFVCFCSWWCGKVTMRLLATWMHRWAKFWPPWTSTALLTTPSSASSETTVRLVRQSVRLSACLSVRPRVRLQVFIEQVWWASQFPACDCVSAVLTQLSIFFFFFFFR